MTLVEGGINVLHISTTDGSGGASRAARRLHEGLRQSGVRSRMAVGHAGLGGQDIVEITAAAAPSRLGRLLRAEKLLPKLSSFVGELPLRYPSSHLLERADVFRHAHVIHLHNLHGRYFDHRVIHRWSRSHPIVWTLHDMWALTGHCAYSFDCQRWRTGCGPCPLFERENRALDDIPQPPWDNTGSEWRRKRFTYSATPIAVIAPSRWLLGLASESILAQHPRTSFHHVPYGLDTAAYRPVPKDQAREMLGLLPGRDVLLFSAGSLTQERKGLRYLLDALRGPELADRDLQLLTFGAGRDIEAGFATTRSLGTISDERIQAIAYSAADVAVVPSLADNQPLVALEAMACGAPVIASSVGGLPELVRDMETGLVAPAADSRALGRRIARLLDDRELRARLSEKARRFVVDHHGIDDHVRAYREIYSERLEQGEHAIGS